MKFPSLTKIARAITGRSPQARYDAAGTGRRMRGWNPPKSGPNLAMAGVDLLRARARDAERNDWAGESASQRWVTNLVGWGITPRLSRFKAGARKEELQKLWDEWVPNSDADCVLNFYAQQALVVRAWLGAGEVFVRRRMRDESYGMAVPLQLQVIEADYVPMLDLDQDPRLPIGNRVRSGIELNKRGKRVAYWLHREHPGDNTGGVIDQSQLLRIPATEIAHIYEVKRPGQLRGVPPLAATLARLRMIGDYDDAVLERQKLANLFVAFITRGLGDGTTDPLTGLSLEYAEDGGSLMPLAPGIMQELGHGENVQFSNPPEAGTTYSDYMRTQHLGTAAAAGLPYEIFSGDIANVSDRTLRMLVNEFRRFAEQRQWLTIIPMFCQRARDWWTDAAVLAGQVNMAEAADVAQVAWAPHGWAYIHPVQDVQGKQMEVQAGFRSRSSVIGERGDDPEQVDAERKADQDRADKLGLAPAGADAPADTAAPQPEDQNDNRRVAPG